MWRTRWPRPADPGAGDGQPSGGLGTVARPAPPGTGEPGWRGALRLLRGPLRRLVTGQALGQAGDGLAQISFAQLVVFDIGRGATPARVAGVLAATLLPFTLVGPFAGVLIDRWPRRGTLVVTSWARAVIAVGAGLVAVTRSPVLAYAGVLVLLASSRFVLAAKGAVLPRTVAPTELVTANATSAVIGMVAAFTGAVLGSTFVSWSVPAGFAVAAVAYLLAGVAFRRLPPMGGGEHAGRLGHRLRQAWNDLVDGVATMVRRREIGRPLLAVWAHRLLLGAGFILLVLAADSRYHLEASGYGLGLAVTGLAAFCGTVAAPWLARRWRPQTLLPVAFLPPAGAALAAGFEPDLAGLLVALAVAAVSFQCLKVLADALVGRAAPDQVRGRVFAGYDVLYNLAFVLAGLAMVPLWQPGRERALLWWLAAGFGLGWLGLARLQRSWPFGAPGEPAPAQASAPVAATRAVPPVHRWPWRGAALLAGAFPALAFPAPSLWWLAWVGLVPWLLVLRAAPGAREAAVRGWFGAAGFLLAVHHWLLPSTGPFLLAIVGLLAVLWMPWSAAAWWLLAPPVTGRRLAAALAVLPAGWVVIEAIRSWSSLGGPWGLLGASQWRVPALLAPASLGGVWLVGFLVLVANTAVAAAVGAGGVRTRAAAAVTVAVAVAAGPLWYRLQAPPVAAGSVTVAVVQPGLIDDAAARLDRGLALTERLPAGRFGLVVWGESSVGFDLDARPDLLARLRAEAARLGTGLLVNTDARAGTGIRKTSVLIGADGVRGRYTKMRLVPFGEYVPFRPVLGWLTDITKAAPEDRRRGAALALLPADRFGFAPLICFESAFPDLSRTATARGAALLVFQTATSTFQGSWAPAQHASLAAVRAVETGRATVHAALTGTSAAFDPRGHRLAWLDTHRSGVVEVTVPLPAGRTPYVRYGDWLVGLSFLVVAGAAVVASLRPAATGRPAAG